MEADNQEGLYQALRAAPTPTHTLISFFQEDVITLTKPEQTRSPKGDMDIEILHSGSKAHFERDTRERGLRDPCVLCGNLGPIATFDLITI